MKTYKYKFGSPSNIIRIGNLLDDMWQVHAYFHKWQRHRYKDGLVYANYHAMCAHLTELKRTTHPYWNALPSQAIQCELKRIDAAYQRFSRNVEADRISSRDISLSLSPIQALRVGK